MSHNTPDNSATAPSGLIDSGRRRFGRRVAPVVVGSLLSEPVLAGTIPYKCTLSGGLSGNTSAPRDLAIDCNTLGKSPGYWKNKAWPAGGPLQGTLPAAGKCYGNIGAGGTAGQVFNGYTRLGNALPALFFCKGGTTYQSNDPAYTGGGTAASMLQVLGTKGGNNGSLVYAFARITVATILNYFDSPTTFPLSPDKTIAMFNAVYAGGNYAVNGTTSWNRAKVEQYFDYLNDGGSATSPF